MGKLFNQRAAYSSAKNLVVFSHYPTDYITAVTQFIATLKNNSKHNILYLGGHRHSIDQSSTTSIAPNDNWLVGGGGGWSCDGPQQGFLVGEISTDFQLTTYPVLVDKSTCCPATVAPTKWKGDGCAWTGCDNCIKMDPQTCKCRELNPDGPCTACPNSTSRGVVCSGSACSVRVKFQK